MPLLISSCLLGKKVRYDGRSNELPPAQLEELRSLIELVPICPEVVGGLPVPRPPAEIEAGDGKMVLAGGAKVRGIDGNDVTDNFLAGAKEALWLCQTHDITNALLAARSPSCGVGRIYDGTFAGTMQAGDGVTAALLRDHAIRVFSSDQVDELLAILQGG